MKSKAYLFIYLIATFILVSCSKKEDNINDEQNKFKLETGVGVFTYDNYTPLATKPIKVWYYNPNKANAKVLIVMHGMDRQGEAYRNTMLKHAEDNDVLLIVPEFASADYNSRLYHEGGVVTSQGVLRASTDWTFSIIEPLFEYVKQHAANTSEKYDIFGFSAGCQFVHRFISFVPTNKADRVVAASAGAYTLPNYAIKYPHGFQGMTSVVPANNMRAFYAKETYIVVGERDNNANDTNLPKDPEDVAQGAHRLERTENYYNKSKTYATQLETPFNWTFKIIPNAGHVFSQIATPVANILYPKN